MKLYFLFSFLFFISCNKSTPVSINKPIKYNTSQFIFGVDLSYANAMEEEGAVYQLDNKPHDVFKIFSDKGSNLVRIRLWHSPDWQIQLYGKYKYNHFDDVAKSIKRAKDNGMEVLLDFHFSDDWADPSKQELPKAWENKSYSQVKDSIFSYTTIVLKRLKEKKLLPEYVQIGNENNSGIVHPFGKINNNDFKAFADMLSSGINAVKRFNQVNNANIKIIIHVAQLQNVDWWLQGLKNQKILEQVDMVGISHYFKWSSFHSMLEITNKFKDLTAKFNKPLIIMETAFPWTVESNDSYKNIIGDSDNKTTYEISPTGQEKYMIALTQAVIDGGGKGIIYWEPGWISTPTFFDRWGKGSSWENVTFFGFNGNTLPVFNYLTYGYRF